MRRVMNSLVGGTTNRTLAILLTAVWLFLPLAAANSGIAAAQVATATASRLGGDHKRTRFIMDLDREVPFRVFALADPYRIIVDLPQIAFHLPADAGQKGRGLITAYRYGLLAVGKSRIVLDADRPVTIDKSFVLPPQEGQPARLVIDLTVTDRATFQRQIARQLKPAQQKVAALPFSPTAPKDHSAPPVVVIDPGHGGIDAGALGPDGVQEKDLVLAFAMTLKEMLEKTAKYKVLLTRSEDVFLPLSERVDIARHAQADLFISVHADKFHASNVRGATVYTLSEEASDAEAAALAQKENKADIIAGLDLAEEPGEVTDILIDLARRETKNFSVHLARTMVRSMRGTFKLNKNPHRSAGFRVLTAPDVPSVLLELGYVSNDRDVRDLASDKWREQAAQSVLESVEAYFATRFAGSTAN